MARRRRKKDQYFVPKNPLEAVLYLIFVALLMIWNYIKEHPVVGVLLVTGIVLLIAWRIEDKKRKRQEYLKWYYDRDRRISELNANSLIDIELTKNILEAAKNGRLVELGKRSEQFDEIKEAYMALVTCEDTIYGTDNLDCSLDASPYKNMGFEMKIAPIILKHKGENDGGYTFLVFPETVLAFIVGPEKTVFLAAYKPEALDLSYDDGIKTTSVVVQEKTQNTIRYYDKFVPVKDAEIISSEWKVTNKNGSRSFKGGLLPENNPLTFKLRYGKLTLTVGDYTSYSYFSNGRAVRYLVRKYEDLKSNSSPNERVRSDHSYKNEERKVNDDHTNETQEKAVNRPVEDKNVSSSTERLSEEEIRNRNRQIAKQAAEDINGMYQGKYDFKVYQVRKPRPGWAMQDAGIYTYVFDEQNNKYTIEFDIFTNLDRHESILRFSIWGKTKELVDERYKATVTRCNMQVNEEGYSVRIRRDYEKMSESQILTVFEKDCTTLLGLVSQDVI